VFTAEGKPLRRIGRAGEPKAGPYDPLHMNNPNGLTVDCSNRLWVAETDHQPKRVSIWTLDGKLVKAFYGPAQYGGGGKIDPQDKTRFYYHGMEFKLDWDKGTFQLARVFFRPGPKDYRAYTGDCIFPEAPLYRARRRYFTNCYNTNPTGGTGLSFLHLDEDGIAVPVAALGSAGELRWWGGFPRAFAALPSFTVRWTGSVMPKFPEAYTFCTHSDDGVRLSVNGKAVIDNWTDHNLTEDKGTIGLKAGQKYEIKLEFYQGGGGAVTSLLWSSASEPKEIIPTSQLFPPGSAKAEGLKGEYYGGKGEFKDFQFTRVDPKVAFNWPNRSLPVPENDQTKGFNARIPAGVDPTRDRMMFSWSDLNSDGRVQAEEVTFIKADSAGVVVMDDLSFAVSRVNGTTMRYAPVRFTDKGVPVYDINAGETLVAGVQGPCSSGGGQALVTPDGWTVLSLGVKPFAPQSMRGALKGVPMWSYPSLWPGLHASHEAPAPDRPGELIGTTRLLGDFATPRGSDAGPMWAVNGNMGSIYLFTADGLFAATLFKDARQGKGWDMPVAQERTATTRCRSRSRSLVSAQRPARQRRATSASCAGTASRRCTASTGTTRPRP